jgi:hypothetical protein
MSTNVTREIREPIAGYGDPPKMRALRHVVRSRFAELPGIYLPFARLRYPGPSPKVIDRETEFVIDGYTRSASTFAVHAFQSAQSRPVRLAHHLHAPAQLIVAARRRIPTIVVIREPEGAVLSQVIREPHVSIRGALVSYQRFYSRLLPYAGSFVVGEFEEVTTDFGSVIGRVNDRFGTSFAEFEATEENVRRCFELIKERPTEDAEWRDLILGFESGTVTLPELLAARPSRPSDVPGGREAWIPSEDRSEVKRMLQERWFASEFDSLRERAIGMYHEFIRASDG